VAVNPRMVQPGSDAELIKAHFNSMTPENAMKMGPIHPEENRYNWKDADAIADFAQQNNIKLRGHTLCWHNQTPRWFFTDSTGKTVGRECTAGPLKRHITDVMGRYKGRILCLGRSKRSCSRYR
jgi:endo-1,4-beta-xylanase